MKMKLYIAAATFLLSFGLVLPLSAKEIVLQTDSGKSEADFTLSDPLHTVHGKFKEQRGEIHFEPSSGTVSGEIVFDATSGSSGNASRDRKMQQNVLESGRYPEIAFRPEAVHGEFSASGTSTLQVHGTFTIHGSGHEIDVPITLNLINSEWKAAAHFQVPYVKWGMKNPSLLFLRVGDTVDIDVLLVGKVEPR